MKVPRGLSSRFRRERGQTMVEFAIIVPILLLVLLAILQFGIVFHNYITVTDAARAGARQAAVGRGMADPVGAATTRVRNSAVNLNQSKLGVNVTGTWTQGSDVTVTVTYPYSVSILGLVVKSGTLSTKTVERVE